MIAGLAVGLSVVLMGSAMLAGDVLLHSAEIAYVSYHAINPDIFVIDINHALTYNLTRSAAYDVAPAWSPDGRWIAFASDRDGRRGIYVMDPFGEQVRRLTPDDNGYTLPFWSSDGQRVYFFALNQGTDAIYSVDFDGGNFQTISANDPSSGSIRLDLGIDPSNISRSLSPDGSRIAFLTFRDQGWAIYISTNEMRSDARLLARIGRFTETPVWSPDGEQMAFIALRDNTTDLYVIDVDGGGAPQRLTANRAIDSSPAWRP